MTVGGLRDCGLCEETSPGNCLDSGLCSPSNAFEHVFGVLGRERNNLWADCSNGYSVADWGRNSPGLCIRICSSGPKEDGLGLEETPNYKNMGSRQPTFPS